jgi:hypothetical protein
MDIFTALSPASTISVLWDHPECVEHAGKQHRIVTIAEEENSVTLPVGVAFNIAAELLMFLMDEDDACNDNGLTLGEYLGDADEMELRRILARISDPEGPTYTNPA